MELVKLTKLEFSRIARLIYDHTGIHLPDTKLKLLSNRLRPRLKALKLDSFQTYYKLLLNAEKRKDELSHFLSAVTTNETYFFRNNKLWQFFQQTWLPEIVARKKGASRPTIRICSAASSSGEEAYTAAICLREKLPDFSRWRTSIIGYDISDNMLEKARAAEYNDYAVSRMTKTLLNKWFEKDGQVYRLHSDIRKMVTFQFHNLRDPFFGGRFDLIFLRNVLMYFDAPMNLKVINNVSAALSPGGYLFVGDVDPIRNTPELNQAMKLEYREPNLYQKPVLTAVAAKSS